MAARKKAAKRVKRRPPGSRAGPKKKAAARKAKKPTRGRRVAPRKAVKRKKTAKRRRASTADGTANKRTAGLILWKPGQSGNPSGSSTRARLRPLLVERLKAVVPGDRKKRQGALAVIDAWIKSAVKGNAKAAKDIVDRMDGSPKETVELVGDASKAEIFITVPGDASPVEVEKPDRKE